MALSENLFSTLNRTFRKRRRKMGDIAVWENISISIKMDEDGTDPPQEEVNVTVLKTSRLILIECVYVEDLLKKTFIRFGDIHQIRSPTISSIMLDLENGEKVTLTFGAPAAKDDFYETITIDSSDSGNSEGS